MSPPPDIESIRAALRHVADPEIGANIVDLGLVYSIAFDDKLLRVEMTMTSPACPMGEMILDDAYTELARVLPADYEADIRVVCEVAPSGTAAVMKPSETGVMVKSARSRCSAPAITPSSKPNRKPAIAATDAST